MSASDLTPYTDLTEERPAGHWIRIPDPDDDSPF